MEGADNEPEEKPEASASEKRVSTKKDEKEYKTLEEQEKESQKRIINLQRDLTTSVTNIRTAADSKVVRQRTQLSKANKIRAELLENDEKSSQEKFDEIMRGWSVVDQKVIPQDLQKALNKQQQLCAALIQDKKKLINDLQQELKIRGDCFVKNLRKNAEEMNLMIEKMEDQISIMTKAYREELSQTERVHQQEIKFLLTKDTADWDQDLKEIWDTELKSLAERRKKLKEYQKQIETMRFEIPHKEQVSKLEILAKKQDLEQKNQCYKGAVVLAMLKHKDQTQDVQYLFDTLSNIKLRMQRQEEKIKILKRMHAEKQREFTEQNRVLSDKYKRQIQKYEQKKKETKHFAITDAKTFEEMWLMVEAELKQLAQRALHIDSRICKQVFGLSWRQPHTASFELSDPSQPQEPAPNVARPLLQSSKRSQETYFERSEAEMFKQETAVKRDGCPEGDGGKKQKEVMELLCSEIDFLMEDKVLKLLAHLENEDQTSMKLGSLSYSLGIDDKDLPELVDFLLKYEQQQREQAEDARSEFSDLAEAAETSVTTSSTSELIHPNHVLPALKSFLEHKRLRERSAHQRSSYAHTRGSSEDNAYLESLGNVISEEKIKLWEAAEQKLKQYHAVLTEISDLVPETERLRQKNTELRIQLQQRLSSAVS